MSKRSYTGIANHFMVVFLTCSALTIYSCKHSPLVPDPIVDVIDTTTNGGGNNGGGNGGGGSGGGGGGGGNTDPCDPDTVYFVNDILPIFTSNCAKSGCHDAGTAQEGIILTDYNSIMNTGDIEAYDPDDGKIWEAINEDDPDDRMPPPPNPKLTSEQKDMIYTWIMQGAKNNSCSGDCDTSNVTFSGVIFPIIQNNCLGCHSGSFPSGGIDLSAYNGVQQVALDGRLFGAVNHLEGFTPMPQGGTLQDCEIDQLNIWINAGAPNN